MVNRDRHDITLGILRKATSGTRKTELMRDVGLSYAQTKQYLRMLLQNHLLEIDEKNSIKTTKKGLEFLEKCEECPLFKWYKQRKSGIPFK